MITRRDFLRDAALMGTAGALGPISDAIAAEPPPETKRIRLPQAPAVCIAPLYIAEELLRGEGFTDVQYVKITSGMQLYSWRGSIRAATNFSPRTAFARSAT